MSLNHIAGGRGASGAINRDRAERLIEEGRMTEAGLRAVKEAKSNGR